MERITKYCKCGCENAFVLKFDHDDGDASLQLVSDNFYSHQNVEC